MTNKPSPKLAIVYPGDAALRLAATPENNRFAPLFAAFAAAGVHAEPAVYDDALVDEVRAQLLQMDAVLVWINPLNATGRTTLDAMLREVAAAGVFVSAHPDVILKLGTKEVLYQTRHLGWGCATHRYGSLQQLRDELPRQLAAGAARVLKQHRGNDGIGVWKVQLASSAAGGTGAALPNADSLLWVRHAKRGCVEEQLSLQAFFEICSPYFDAGGSMIDQPYQARLTEGITRAYLVHDRVAGFGHQAVNALFPAPPGAAPSEAPVAGPRLYHPSTTPAFAHLKQLVESDFVPAAQQTLGITTAALPIIWDCDFLLGARDAQGRDTYVLCEINVSSVSPYPESALPLMVEATLAAMRRRQRLAAR